MRAKPPPPLESGIPLNFGPESGIPPNFELESGILFDIRIEKKHYCSTLCPSFTVDVSVSTYIFLVADPEFEVRGGVN